MFEENSSIHLNCVGLVVVLANDQILMAHYLTLELYEFWNPENYF
jgi:hypothetical protein